MNKRLIISSILSFSLLSSCIETTQEPQIINWYNGIDYPSSVKSAVEGDYYYDQDDGIIYKYSENNWVEEVTLGGGNDNLNKTAYELYCAVHPSYTKTQKEWSLDLINGNLKDAVTYKVVFNPNNGSSSFTKIVTENKKVEKPTDPLNGSLEFLGWYNQYDELWSFGGFNITENVTLTAKWSENTNTEDESEHSNNTGDNSENIDNNTNDNSGNIDDNTGNSEITTPSENIKTLNFNSNSITYNNKSDINYYEYGCPTMDNGTTKPKVLVIPVEFSDVTAQSKDYTIQAIKNAFLPKTQTNANLDYFSVFDYFYASSYQQLSLDITVCENWFMPTHASTYYASYYDSEGYFMGDQLVLDEALSSLSTTMDLASFDSDGDTVIDSVVIINTLAIDGNTDFYWAYQYFNYLTNSNGEFYEYDNVSANTYLWAPYQFMFEDAYGEYSLEEPTNTYTFIHEFSHVLGADDYYDYSELSNHPLDGYDIMDITLADHNPFTKMHYGWIDSSKLITSSSSITVELSAFEETGDTIIIANNFDESKGIYQEYWLICYYNNTKLNEDPYGLFENGIVVYHVNASLQEDDYGYIYFENSNSDASYEYGSEDNLIEFVKNGNKFVYTVGEKLSSATVDDNNKKVPYTFEVDSITYTKATLTFKVNK